MAAVQEQFTPQGALWRMVHCMALFYDPLREPKAHRSFKCLLKSIGVLLPDDKFKERFNKALEKYLPELDSAAITNEILFKWTYTFHNAISPLNYDSFLKVYFENEITLPFWSRATWKVIHYLAKNYPKKYDYEKAISYKAFIVCLQSLLPCGNCRNHLRKNLEDHPIDGYFYSNETLYRWSYLLHEEVNRQTKKRIHSHEETWPLY